MPTMAVPTEQVIADAVQRLRQGEIIAFPTETVYGLGADTLNAEAVAKIYALKGRPSDNPLIAHVLDWTMAKPLIRDAAVSSELIGRLTARFWPGPLTLVLQKSDVVPLGATAHRSTIALRSPAHPVARRILQLFGSPISAPSANRSGHVSPTTAAHVAEDFANVPDLLIIDGGPCEIGIESTVLDVTTSPPRVLRPGQVTLQQLREIIPEVVSPAMLLQAESPGTSPQHYAPRTPAVMVNTHELHAFLARSDFAAAVLTFNPERVSLPHHAVVMSTDPSIYARELYGKLRQADAMNRHMIVIETPPSGGDDHDLWSAIHDRLRRATA